MPSCQLRREFFQSPDALLRSSLGFGQLLHKFFGPSLGLSKLRHSGLQPLQTLLRAGLSLHKLLHNGLQSRHPFFRSSLSLSELRHGGLQPPYLFLRSELSFSQLSHAFPHLRLSLDQSGESLSRSLVSFEDPLHDFMERAKVIGERSRSLSRDELLNGSDQRLGRCPSYRLFQTLVQLLALF